MYNKLFIKKTTVFVILFFSFFMFQNNFIYSNEEDILKKARSLINEGYLNDAITELTQIIDRLKNIDVKRKKVAEAYYLLARVHYDGGDDGEFEKNIRMVYKVYTDFKTDESNYELRDKVEKIRSTIPFKTKRDTKKIPEKTLKKDIEKKEELKVKEKRVITKIGKKGKKKKFPILIVVLGVVVVLAAVVLLGGKKKSSSTPVSPPTPTTDKGSISVESVPDGASIWLDGSDTGILTNNNLDNISVGAHSVRLVRDGFIEYETTVTVSKDQQASVSVILVMAVEWINITAGDFQMGDNFNDGKSDERPVHTVFLDSYSISKYEITFDHYDIFCEATNRSKPQDGGWGRGNRPVIYVSWNDAKAFCDWMSERTGQTISLPTEAQWEKAARGTDQRKYPWGNTSPNSGRCNYNQNEGRTMVVGSYPSGESPYGVHDMAGNVIEWCSDWFSTSYYSNSPRNNPEGPASGSRKVGRGGSWYSQINGLRTTNRNVDYPTGTFFDIGFRLVKTN